MKEDGEVGDQEMEEDEVDDNEMEEGDEDEEDMEEDMEKQLMDDEVAHEDEPESESHPDCDEKGLRARLHRMNINQDRAPVRRIAPSPSRPTSISLSIQLAGTKMFRKVDDCMCTQSTFKELMGKASKTLGFDVRGRLSTRTPGQFTKTGTKLDVDSDEAWQSFLQMCWSQKRGRYTFLVVAENADI